MTEENPETNLFSDRRDMPKTLYKAYVEIGRLRELNRRLVIACIVLFLGGTFTWVSLMLKMWG